jgi:transcriptional regulator with XRE-family HTH domain
METNYLKEFIKQTKMKQKKLAIKLGVSPAYISQVKSGKKKLSKRCEKVLNQIYPVKTIKETIKNYTIVKDSFLDKITELLIKNPNKINEDLYNFLLEILTK